MTRGFIQLFKYTQGWTFKSQRPSYTIGPNWIQVPDYYIVEDNKVIMQLKLQCSLWVLFFKQDKSFQFGATIAPQELNCKFLSYKRNRNDKLASIFIMYLFY